MPFEVLDVEKNPDVGRPLASLANIEQELLYPTTRLLQFATSALCYIKLPSGYHVTCYYVF